MIYEPLIINTNPKSISELDGKTYYKGLKSNREYFIYNKYFSGNPVIDSPYIMTLERAYGIYEINRESPQ